MDFSLTTVFVVPVGNVLPLVNTSTENLTEGKFGIFKDDQRLAATAGNIGTANFIQFAQGQPDEQIGSKISDKIKACGNCINKIKKWYKIVGSATANVEIWEIGDFTAHCGEDLTLTIRAHSSYIDTISFNGLTRSVTIKTPCCECGADPCDVVDNEAVVDLFIAAIDALDAAQVGPNALKLTSFLAFTKVGVGPNAVLHIEGLPLTKYAQPCDLAANPYEFDRLWFRPFVFEGPDTSADFQVYDNCDQVATITLVQKSTIPRLIDTEVAQVEKDYFSYQSPHKHLFRMPGYNPYFKSYVTAGTVYDNYVLQFDELHQDDSWAANIKEDERVLIFIPQAQSAAFEAVANVYLGVPLDKTGGPGPVPPDVP